MLHSAYSTLHNDQRHFKNHQQFEKFANICSKWQTFCLLPWKRGGGMADKSSIYFLLSKTHSILLADKIARFAKIKKISYLPAVCGLNSNVTAVYEWMDQRTKSMLQEPVEHQIRRKKWSWIGHTPRKPTQHTTKQALTRNHKRPRNIWCKEVETEMSKAVLIQMERANSSKLCPVERSR